jgi:N-acetylmuramoyl-L-alanine amidase CwlA
MGSIKGISYHSKQIRYNRTPKTRTKKDIKAIVIHYTANYDKGSGGQAHFNYFDGANRNASADVFIDDHSIWKINDWTKYYTWAIGDGNGRYGWTNSNTISIEMCVNSDGDFNKTVANTIAYIRELHKEGYTTTLIRHYDASRKLCPVYYVDLSIPGYNKAYTDFRNKVFAKEEPINNNNSSNNSKSEYTGILKEAFEKGWFIGKKYKETDNINFENLCYILRNFENYMKKK